MPKYIDYPRPMPKKASDAWAFPENPTLNARLVLRPRGIDYESLQFVPKDPNLHKSPEIRYTYAPVPIYG